MKRWKKDGLTVGARGIWPRLEGDDIARARALPDVGAVVKVEVRALSRVCMKRPRRQSRAPARSLKRERGGRSAHISRQSRES